MRATMTQDVNIKKYWETIHSVAQEHGVGSRAHDRAMEGLLRYMKGVSTIENSYYLPL
jgi:hypothetical protein